MHTLKSTKGKGIHEGLHSIGRVTSLCVAGIVGAKVG